MEPPAGGSEMTQVHAASIDPLRLQGTADQHSVTIRRRTELRSYRGAAIADTARGMEGPTMRLELLRASDEQSAWQVALEGDVVVAFAGPDAEQRAQRCYTELKARLNPPDEAEPPEEPS